MNLQSFLLGAVMCYLCLGKLGGGVAPEPQLEGVAKVSNQAVREMSSNYAKVYRERAKWLRSDEAGKLPESKVAEQLKTDREAAYKAAFDPLNTAVQEAADDGGKFSHVKAAEALERAAAGFDLFVR